MSDGTLTFELALIPCHWADRNGAPTIAVRGRPPHDLGIALVIENRCEVDE